MRFIDLSADRPEANLALDEALLDSTEQGHAGDTLRLWESPRRFVVVGSGQAVAEEADVEACARDGVPILRRCSAGGCVLQGPGCLNFSLALRLAGRPEIQSLHHSYRHILGRITEEFAARGIMLELEGICDLTLGGRKVSGNAQRRRRNAILHHGTLLYSADIALMNRYIREPRQRPDYRGERDHAGFVGELPVSPGLLRGWIRSAFRAADAPGELEARERDHWERLVREKYTDAAWNLRK